jgi:iron complex outermembrane receptor protein
MSGQKDTHQILPVNRAIIRVVKADTHFQLNTAGDSTMRIRELFLTGAACFSLTITPATVLAQEDDSAEASQGETLMLEEVTVTAQKREQSLQDVPIAVSAFSGEMIDDLKAWGMYDITTRTPNFTIRKFNIAEPGYQIRGIRSQTDSAGGDPSIALFVDEVYMGRPGGANIDFFDLERVEILRGPQGTLFGRNTAGGALSVITMKPQEEFDAKAMISYGNYNALELRGVVNTPLNETSAMRFSISHRSHDGYSENILTGDELNDENNWSARVQYLANPNDRLMVHFSFDYSKDDTEGNGRVPFPVVEGTAIEPLIRFYVPEGTSPRKSYAKPESFQDRESWGLLGRIEYDYDFATLTSITSYRELEFNWWEDLATIHQQPGGPPWVLERNDDMVSEDSDQLSQEFRLTSNSTGNLDWVAGLFYFKENVYRSEQFATEFLLAPILGGHVDFIQDVTSKSYAAFGHGSYRFNERFSLTGGLRYTYDKKNATPRALNLVPGDPVPGIPLNAPPYNTDPNNLESASESWDKVTGTISLDFFDNAGNLYYGKVSLGYKSGAFVSQATSLEIALAPLEPEEVWNYEIGTKLMFADDRVRLNGAIFKMDYSNLQSLVLTDDLTLVSFTSGFEIEGIELELSAAVTSWLEMGGYAAYFKSKNTDTDDKASEKSANIYANGLWSVSNGEVSARINYAWWSDGESAIDTNPETRIPSHALLDAQIAYWHTDWKTEFALWGKNLADEETAIHIIPFLGNGFALFAPPRTYGISATWRYR